MKFLSKLHTRPTLYSHIQEYKENFIERQHSKNLLRIFNKKKITVWVGKKVERIQLKLPT